MLGCGGGSFSERLLDRPAGGVVDMDDATVGVPALPCQVPAFGDSLAGVERDAECGQPVDGGGGVFDDIFDGGAVVEAGACDHRVLDVAFIGIAGFEDSGDAALRPGGRAGRHVALGEHCDPEARGEIEGSGQPGSAGADDDDIEVAGVGWEALSHAPASG